MHDQDAKVRDLFTHGGTVMGAEANAALGGSQMDRATRGMIGGGFAVAGRGDVGTCQLVVSSRGRPCARITLTDDGELLWWEQL